ncbi:E3 ubiquitin-protein ligase Topors [Rhinatrema bivittatum]|uniref:E3 ubiquitin-protein ligase Topors n=1 Tax=Rhinatrema bivittatum TaxID=194408 RepID=UPI00112AB824|nr:E3 ubiquitin-protein ligase Topors [Rhinatrema bivittatum]XP_029471454.1 E3 ubiquitin-protein ligase Topors [Rhinatrema bivittatum]XP_029471461.1 E3 ubiquitin-protein ligase Topors [Rhinatrema bivittatum]XP_029471471.1 E3 ubiquitin-protein ligase Topors [Rhinatrema bivittatum]XP_029471478.1 E3 ubiquitin-protein ligase Topors [Rhinatrema bivittatum]XP_029471488.1 E3 ubiquitin-protein ligase Topors [Rhinatrema bivittatum]XP_029471497.1 E3 ubiquitin-protein ligase Topors [Rhinatrema bivittatu
MMASATKERTVGSSFSPKAGTSKRQHNPVSTDASPDSKCPICLDRFDNMSYLDRCLHRFCFRCIQEWSKNKAECPLCKQPFHSIFHSVRAENDFKEYVLRPSQNGSFASPEGHRFRYRTTLTRERRTPIRSRRSTSVRRTLSPPDNGVLFEGLVGQTTLQRDGGIHQIIRQFASRRQANTEGRTSRHIEEQDIINFRRALYRSGVRVRSIQDGGRYREISAEFFRRNPACLHRLVPWLKRELLVLFGAHGSLVNIVQHIIMSNVTRYDLESQTFAEDLKPFLLHRTDHFLHEFISFARCPYNIDAYDLHANYDYPAPSYEEGSHSDSSVITISPDEGDSRDPDLLSSVTSIDQAPWDDETPGPSYSTLEPAPTTVSSLVDSSESSDEEGTRNVGAQVEVKADPGVVGEDNTSPSDDCLIVGYIKPLAERTPELVQLSSDSEESLYEEKTENNKKLQPHQLTFFSDNSDSGSSSSTSSTASKDRKIEKPKQKETSSFSSKFNNSRKDEKDKGRRRSDLSCSRSCVRRSSTRRESNYTSKKRERSRSPDSISRFSHARDHRNKKKHHSKERHRSSRSWESARHRDRRDNNRLTTREQSLSRRSQTVSLTSESSVSRDDVRSGSRSTDHGSERSRSRDSDYNYPVDNYRSTYRWECTYFTRNRGRDSFDQSYRRKTRGKSLYQRQSTSPEFRTQCYSERKNPQNKRIHNKNSQYYRERFRSRSRSSNRSRMTAGGSEKTRSEKPSGKRKYKTRHLEQADQVNETNHQSALNLKGKENCPLKSQSGHGNRCNEDDLTDSRASSESRHKRKKKTRSSSVEIVYEGKTTDGSRHHKKKKKKQKKKHKRHQSASSKHTSPVVITIDSDSEIEKKEDMECDDDSNWASTNLPNESETPAVPGAYQRKDSFDVDILGKDNSPAMSDEDVHTVTSNMNLEAATGILDDFHFDESSDEQTLAMADRSSDSGIETIPTTVESAPAEQPRPFSSPRTICEENLSERPPLILRLPKSLIEKNYLFDHSGKKT